MSELEIVLIFWKEIGKVDFWDSTEIVDIEFSLLVADSTDVMILMKQSLWNVVGVSYK